MRSDIYQAAADAVRLLKENGLKVAAAESCTGGLVTAYITAVPGASQVFEEGIVSYSCRIKNKALGVSLKTLEAHGAISRETALEMAAGVRLEAGADIGVSVTGAAGPDPSEGHSPGLVYIAADTASGGRAKELNITYQSREQVRETATAEVLRLLIKTAEEVKK